MQYLNKVNLSEIKDRYDFFVAWGTGSLFNMNYQKDHLPVNMLVDGTKTNIGNKIDKLVVYGPEDIKEKIEGKALIIIYAIYEVEILNQIAELGLEVDTIIYNLLVLESIGIKRYPFWNGKHADDILLLELVRRLGVKKKEYLDIGVCHPVMRNNTYLFYEMGWKGVLVEPNPIFHSLIKDYREKDILLPNGAGVYNGELEYYAFLDRLGYGTFDKEIGELRCKLGLKYSINKIPIIEINEIIENNFKEYPTIIDIDVEGMDFELIQKIDTDKYPIEIIMCETLSNEDKYSAMMIQKGYLKYAKVGENTIFYRNDLNISGLFTQYSFGEL